MKNRFKICDFEICDFLNIGLKVKLKKLGRISKKPLYISHFFNKNCIIYLIQKTDMFIHFSL